MALATVIAGAYTATYDSAGMGQQEDGFRLRMSFSKEEIRSNTYGDAVIDAVYRGGNCFLSANFIEADSVLSKTALSPVNPYGFGETTSAVALGNMGKVGRLDFALSKAIVLSAITGLAAFSHIASLTASSAIVDQNLSQEHLMANRAKFLALTFRLYPYLSTDNKWFSVT